MTSVLVILAEGFEEIEAVAIIDVLRRAELGVTVAALTLSPVRGAHEIVIAADTTLAELDTDRFDALVLPGGMPGAKHLREDPRVLALVRKFVAESKLTAAICAAPTVLEAAGVLRGRRATSYPGHALPSAIYLEEAVVEDGVLLTSRGVGTTLEFALSIVARLAGYEAASTQRERLLLGPASASARRPTQ